MSDFIDLGKKTDTKGAINEAKPKKVYYPSLYVNGDGEMDLETGQEVLIRGVVTSCTNTTRDGKTSYSCDIEARGLKPDEAESEDGGDGLDAALTKIEQTKGDSADDGDETDE